MHRSAWKVALAALIALCTACSAQGTVSVNPNLSPVETALDAGDATEAGATDEEDESSTDPAAATSGQAATAGAQSDDEPAAFGPWDRSIKAERQAEYDAFRRELHAQFHSNDYPLETGSLPDQALLQQALTGDTLLVQATVTFVDASIEPMVVDVATNTSIELTYTSVDRVQYRTFLDGRWESHLPAPTDPLPGTVETVSYRGRATRWSRGLTPGIARTAYAPLDPDRWYVGASVDSLIRFDLGQVAASASDVWEGVLQHATPLPVERADGMVEQSAPLTDPRVVAYLGYAANNPDVVPVTITTLSDSDGTVNELIVQLEGDRFVESIVYTFTERGEPLSLPPISQVVQDPRRATPDIRPDFYAWTGSGRFRDNKGAEGEGPWIARGAVGASVNPPSSLSMTVADVAILGQLPSYSAPGDQLLIRYNEGSDSSVTGMFAELVPPWARPDVDSTTRYRHDPYNVPADLFTAGLGDEAQWAALQTLPEFVSIDGWDFARVTRGQIDPDFWNYRHRLNDGFFAWLLSEGPDEVFDVTIGADADGRMLRFRLVTTDPDGGGLTWDIDIEHDVDAVVRLPEGPRSVTFSTSQPYIDQVTAATARLDAGDFDAFFEDSRAAYPFGDRSVTPDHLTVVLTQTVVDGRPDAFVWDLDAFGADASPYAGQPTVYLACLDVDDVAWRFDVNRLEELWRFVPDRGSLDDVVVKLGTSTVLYRAEIFATDGDRRADDPCVWNPSG